MPVVSSTIEKIKRESVTVSEIDYQKLVSILEIQKEVLDKKTFTQLLECVKKGIMADLDNLLRR